MGKYQKLSAAELVYMEEIWKHSEGINSEELYSYGDYAVGTISTLLHRIMKKGYAVTIRNGRHKLYVATMTKVQYEQNLINQNLEEALGCDSLENLIASFCGKEKLSEEQGEKLRDFLREIQDD